MPSPVGYDYVMIGTLHAAQLASTQLTQYLSDLQLNANSTGSIARNGGAGPFPLRRAPRPPLEKCLSVPNSPRLAHSILSSRRSSGREGLLERGDSLEDAADSLEEQRSAWSAQQRTNRQLVKYAPILKRFYELAHGSSSPPKKHVQFADDLGMDLEVTRFFTEELDCWAPEPLPRSDWYRGKSADAAMEDEDLVVEISEWQVNFSQPAADYLGFREKLATHSVGLENVIIKHKANSFMGTIKVRNVSFKKDVFVRCSFNGWETFSDFPAMFCGKASDAGDKYDTFSFEISIPAKTDEKNSVEFCIGFRTDGIEYWDSNSGRNYQLITSHMKHKKSADKHIDAYTMHSLSGTETWSQFASWNHLDSNRPYY